MAHTIQEDVIAFCEFSNQNSFFSFSTKRERRLSLLTHRKKSLKMNMEEQCARLFMLFQSGSMPIKMMAAAKKELETVGDNKEADEEELALICLFEARPTFCTRVDNSWDQTRQLVCVTGHFFRFLQFLCGNFVFVITDVTSSLIDFPLMTSTHRRVRSFVQSEMEDMIRAIGPESIQEGWKSSLVDSFQDAPMVLIDLILTYLGVKLEHGKRKRKRV